MRKATSQTLLAALGPTSQAVLGPALVAPGVVGEAVRGVTMTDLAVVTTVPDVEGPLKTSVRLLRLRATSQDEPTPTMPATIMAGTYEAPAGRSPVVPSAGLTARLAGRVAVARVAPT